MRLVKAELRTIDKDTAAAHYAEHAGKPFYDGLISHTQSGYTPLVTVLTPPGVVVCLESTGKLCSVNSLVVPPPPVLTTSGTGGTLPAGTYQDSTPGGTLHD